MIYACPVPPEFASGQYYEMEAGYYLSPAKLQSDYADVRFKRELGLFRKHCRHGDVLDVGCSTGAFLFQLRKRFAGDYELLGTDVSGPALDYAESRGIRIVRGHFPEIDLNGRQFDAVTFWAVLEHLPEPKGFLEKAWSALKPAGECFVLVPNMHSLAARFLGARYRYVYPQHLNYFTRVTLARLVQERFDIIETRFTHLNPILMWQDWRSRGGEVSNAARAALLQRTTAYKQHAWLAPVRILYNGTESLLAGLGLADNLAMVLRKRAS
jgi:2-polyprenyl-3-methyl-5-hydroxy-6-metoxy-1,4-benzoquinol methylase